jgi:choline dehydrogenase
MFRYGHRLTSQPALAKFIVNEITPGNSVQLNEKIAAAAYQDNTCFHTIGTYRMGADEASVVNERLRVRGVVRLRIADCSVFPTLVLGNPNRPVMALTWRASKIILEDQTS